jgi:hypothetical protein
VRAGAADPERPARRRACNRAGTIGRRRVELTPILGHLILGSDPEEGGRMRPPAKYPPEFQRDAVEHVFRSEPRSYGALGMGRSRPPPEQA